MRHAFALILLLLTLTVCASAQVTPAPSLLNFQGRLARPDGTPVANGNYSLRFSLWDALSGGNEKWHQTLASVAVRNGTFAAILDLTSGFTTGNNLRTALNGNTFLEIKIGSATPLAPRQHLLSVGYALRASSVADGSITAGSLASGALNTLSWLLGGNDITNPATQFLGTTSNQPLVFRTNNTEKMRLHTDGNLGLGTTTPAQKLDVRGQLQVQDTVRLDPADEPLIVRQFDTFTSGAKNGFGRWGLFQEPNTLFLGVAGTDYAGTSRITLGGWLVNSNRQDWLTVLEGGNVGVGTITPQAKVHIVGGNLRVDEGQFQSWGPIALHPDVDNNGDGIIQFLNSVGAETMRMHSNGFLGIGTTTPETALHVVGADNNGTVAGLKIVSGGQVLLLDGNEIDSNDRLYLNNNSPDHIVLALGGGNVGVGTSTPDTKLDVNGTTRTRMIEVIGGSDVAEPYHVAPAGDIKPIPGYVVAIDPNKVGQMRVAVGAYNRTVAGIISGANGINPGITLRQKGTVADGELPVASLGRVWCWCDADANGAIEAGDMLTTSATPGHAMRVTDHNRANGAVIGKAMSSLKSGKGLVLVLVSLK
jgi:hypothetical protein